MDKKTPEKTSSPSSLPESAPTRYTGMTESAVIEIYRTLGKVDRAVEELTRQSTDQSKKIDDIGKTVHAGKVLVGAFGIIITALGGVAVFILDKIWNVLVPLLLSKPHH